MGDRFRTRFHAVARALALRLNQRPRFSSSEIRSVLIAHNLRMGDTLMLTPLLARVRAAYPQTTLFRSSVPWVSQCARSTEECSAPRCMDAVSVDRVLNVIDRLLPASSHAQ